MPRKLVYDKELDGPLDPSRKSAGAPGGDPTEADRVSLGDAVRKVLSELELQTALLGKLKARFEAHPERHDTVNWREVQTVLEANPELLWSLNELEAKGHEPDLYHEDENNYYFGTCSKESPRCTLETVYDAEAEKKFRRKHPGKASKGNAEDFAAAMGAELMSADHYLEVLQKKGEFDDYSWSWLKTPEDIRATGFALCGLRDDEGVRVRKSKAHSSYDYKGFRASLKVPKIKA